MSVSHQLVLHIPDIVTTTRSLRRTSRKLMFEILSVPFVLTRAYSEQIVVRAARNAEMDRQWYSLWFIDY